MTQESAAVVDILKALDKIEMTAEIFKVTYGGGG